MSSGISSSYLNLKHRISFCQTKPKIRSVLQHCQHGNSQFIKSRIGRSGNQESLERVALYIKISDIWFCSSELCQSLKINKCLVIFN